MAKNYSELAAFMHSREADPLSLAKVMNGWIWTSLLPAGAGNEPTGAKSVPIVMNASCGWRDVLLESLFEGIGIQHRRVNFYDVPFQANHTATELYINGKWMFFDSTFGLYFTLKGSGVPLSMEEARGSWPDIEIHQSSLTGWQGVFVSPGAVSARAYKTVTDTFAFAPVNYAKSSTVVSGEFYSLYFTKKATYLGDDGKEVVIPGLNRTWTFLTDPNDTKGWKKYKNFFDSKGRLDAKYILSDDGSHKYTHWDRANKYDWLTKVTSVTAGSRLEQRIINYDDKSKDVQNYDASSKQLWAESFTHYSANRKLDYSVTKFDDGSSLSTQYDYGSFYVWSQHTDAYDISGQLVSTTVVLDDGTSQSFNWTVDPKITGTSSYDLLTGSSGTDALFGLEGHDTLDGGGGWDRLEGGTGNDLYHVDNVSDIIVESAKHGHDTVIATDNYVLPRHVEDLVLMGTAIYGTGQEFNNWVVGNAESNVLSGAAGNDRVRGLEGNDLLLGGAGRDTLEGGIGTDTLYGGKDADFFLWGGVAEIGSMKSNADVVKDFSASQGDVLSFSLIDADETRAGNQAFKFIGDVGFTASGQIRYAQSGGETLLYFNTDSDVSAEAVLRFVGKLTPEKSWFVL